MASMPMGVDQAGDDIGGAKIADLRFRRHREAAARANGCVDLIGLSPAFDTATKPDAGAGLGLDGVRALAAQAGLPCVAIGGIDVARAERERTYQDRLPDFAVGVRNNRPDEGKASWDVMFEVMIPLQQSARRAREREALHMEEAAGARRAAAEATLLGELGRAHSTLTGGRDTARLLRGTLLPQAEATRDATRAAFANARVDFDSVLDAERQLIDTRMALLQAEVDARMALADMEKLTGEIK